jgi:hypothetical protein
MIMKEKDLSQKILTPRNLSIDQKHRERDRDKASINVAFA